MEKYDYLQAIIEDVKNFIEWNNIVITSSNVDEMREELYDRCWVEDSVTGNASGSYTCNAWQAEENICHNWDLLEEALQEFGYDESLPYNDSVPEGFFPWEQDEFEYPEDRYLEEEQREITYDDIVGGGF